MYTLQGYLDVRQFMITKDLSPYKVFFLHQEQTLHDYGELVVRFIPFGQISWPHTPVVAATPRRRPRQARPPARRTGPAIRPERQKAGRAEGHKTLTGKRRQAGQRKCSQPGLP